MPVLVGGNRNGVPISHSQYVVDTGAPVTTPIPGLANVVYVSSTATSGVVLIQNASAQTLVALYGLLSGRRVLVPQNATQITHQSAAPMTGALSFINDTGEDLIE